FFFNGALAFIPARCRKSVDQACSLATECNGVCYAEANRMLRFMSSRGSGLEAEPLDAGGGRGVRGAELIAKSISLIRGQLLQGRFVAQNQSGSVQFNPALALEFAERAAYCLAGRADQLCHLVVRQR